MTLLEVPTLDAIASSPELVRELPRETLFSIALRAQTVQVVCTMAMITAPAAAEEDLDQVLSLSEAAYRLGMAERTLKARARKQYPQLLVDNGTNRLTFSKRRIAEYLHAGSAAYEPAGQNAGRIKEGKSRPARPPKFPPELAFRRQGRDT